MKLNYFKETDSLYIDLSSKTSTQSIEISPGVVVDYDATNNVVGIDIDNASKKLDFAEMVLNHLPVEKQSIAA